MKFMSQIVLAILAVVGLVAGVTFVSQYQTGARDPSDDSPRSSSPEVKPAAAARDAELYFPETTVHWEPPTANEFEKVSNGAYDCWFENRNPVPIALGLQTKSCKCADIFGCAFTPEEKARYQRGAPAAAGAVLASSACGLFAGLTELESQAKVTPGLRGVKVKWHRLDPTEGTTVTVPPEGGGLVRISWEGRRDKVGAQLLAVTLWTQVQQSGPSPKIYPKIEMPINYIPALRVVPVRANLEDLGLHETRSTEFVVWSSTRGGFALQAREKTNDPCFQCTCTALDASERKLLSETTNSRVLSAYKVRVVVHERLEQDGKVVQLDLGPFMRRIILTSDVDIDESSVVVSGAVRGEILVGAEEDKGKIALGSFKARSGNSKVVRLTAEQSFRDLLVDRVEPVEAAGIVRVKYLKKLPPSGVDTSTRWDLCVEVPPGSPPGALPEHTAVFLRIPGAAPRFIRIPVSGTAYQ